MRTRDAPRRSSFAVSSYAHAVRTLGPTIIGAIGPRSAGPRSATPPARCSQMRVNRPRSWSGGLAVTLEYHARSSSPPTRIAWQRALQATRPVSAWRQRRCWRGLREEERSPSPTVPCAAPQTPTSSYVGCVHGSALEAQYNRGTGPRPANAGARACAAPSRPIVTQRAVPSAAVTRRNGRSHAAPAACWKGLHRPEAADDPRNRWCSRAQCSTDAKIPFPSLRCCSECVLA